MLMEIDHFDPTLRGRTRHRYSNLFLASRYCNNKKQGNWPSPEALAAGVRFLNCCDEQDYGEHIFEDPTTHRVFGTTPPGKYHVRILDLNAPHLIAERQERSRLRKLLFEDWKRVKHADAAMRAFRILQTELDYLIPVIASQVGKEQIGDDPIGSIGIPSTQA